MKIDGLSNYLINSLQTISDLNLKDGQIIMGKIITMAMDEALLEIAGRQLQARVEGDPPAAPGTVATFQVGKDEAGRILLKFIANVSDTATLPSNEIGSETAIDSVVLKNIRAALQKEGVAPTPANIENMWRNLQDFQNKYQQPLNPQVLAFIFAKKWPVTPGTILTSMVFGDQEARELLWNLLQKSMPEKELAEFITKYVLTTQAGPETLTGKMAAFSDSKGFQNLLEQLFKLNTTGVLEENSQLKTDVKNPSFKNATDISPRASQSAAETTRPEARIQAGTSLNKDWSTLSKNDLQNPIDKTNLIVESKTLGMAGKLGRAEQQKIVAVLEQHITLSKSLPANESATGPNYAIPFLINDQKSGLRELLVKWREEKNNPQNGNTGQLIYVTIPTANMGEINLGLRITNVGTGINFKVNTNDIRKYLLNHIAELKEAIGRSNAAIVVGLKDTESNNQNDAGLDVWM